MNLPANYNNLSTKERRDVRNEYVNIQKGMCKHCNHDLNKKPPKHILTKTIKRTLFPTNFFKYPVHLHHDHTTGATIGAVHNYCNAVLWQYHGE